MALSGTMCIQRLPIRVSSTISRSITVETSASNRESGAPLTLLSSISIQARLGSSTTASGIPRKSIGPRATVIWLTGTGYRFAASALEKSGICTQKPGVRSRTSIQAAVVVDCNAFTGSIYHS